MKFDMVRAWDEAVATITANREVMLIVAGIFFFLPAVAQGFAMPPMNTLFTAGNAAGMQQQMWRFYADFGWMFVLTGLLQAVGTLALLALLRDYRRPTVGAAIRTGLLGVLPAIGAYLLIALGFTIVLFALALVIGLAVAALGGGTGGTLLGFVLFVAMVALLVYASVRVSLLLPVIAIERLMNPVAAIRRSLTLTKGTTGRLFLFYLLLFIAYLVLAMVMGLAVAGLVLVLGQSLSLIVGSVLSGLIGAGFATVFAAVLAAVHRQLSGPSREAVAETFE